MEFYNGTPINGTNDIRKVIKFRDGERKQTKKKRGFRVDKEHWREYDIFAKQQFIRGEK